MMSLMSSFIQPCTPLSAGIRFFLSILTRSACVLAWLYCPMLISYQYLLNLLVDSGRGALAIGRAGVGKSCMIEDLLRKGMTDPERVVSSLQFNTRTNIDRFRKFVEEKLIGTSSVRDRRSVFGQPLHERQKVLMFIDNINAPAPDEFGAQAPLELLRQMIENSTVHCATTFAEQRLRPIGLIGACVPVGGSSRALSPRLLRHFAVLSIGIPDSDSLFSMFGSLLVSHLTSTGKRADLVLMTELARSMSYAAIEVFKLVSEHFRATPLRPHYVFNLRDLSRVFEGMLMCPGHFVTDVGKALRLFFHESSRVFADRFVEESDREQFYNFQCDVTRRFFKQSMTSEEIRAMNIRFGVFGSPLDIELSAQPYNELGSVASLLEVCDNHLRDMSAKKLLHGNRIVLFDIAVDHICRMARILAMSSGHALLVGVDGLGKRTLARLACHVAGHTFFELDTLTQAPTQASLREVLKDAYKSAALYNNSVTLLLPLPRQCPDDIFEDISVVINSGIIPDLFDGDEFEAFLNELKLLPNYQGLSEASTHATFQDALNFSAMQELALAIRKNFHVILSVSSAGNELQDKFRKFPALVSCFSIDWFDMWPSTALLEVAKKWIQSSSLGSFVSGLPSVTSIRHKLKAGGAAATLAAAVLDKVAEVAVQIHLVVSQLIDDQTGAGQVHLYVTPSELIEFLSTFAEVYRNKFELISKGQRRIEAGTAQIESTKTLVHDLRGHLESLNPQLADRARITDDLIAQITEDQNKTNEIRARIAEEERIIAEQAVLIKKLTDEADRDLAFILPALEKANQLLQALDKADVAEVRVYLNPPEPVMRLISAVSVLLGEPEDWASGRLMMLDQRFLLRLVEFDKNHTEDSKLTRLQEVLDHPELTIENLGRISKACVSICQWIFAMRDYLFYFREVTPKRHLTERLHAEVVEIQHASKKKLLELRSVQSHIQRLQGRYEESSATRDALARQISTTEIRQNRANQLLLYLHAEHERWQEQVNRFTQEIEELVGNSLLSAAVIVYSGAFPEQQRTNLVHRWLALCNRFQILHDEEFSLADVLGDELTVTQWHLDGLPQDSMSVDNAILITNSLRTPLIIDPQGRVDTWLPLLDSSTTAVVCHASDSQLSRKVMLAVQGGFLLVLMETEELQGSLIQSLLSIRPGLANDPAYTIKIGDAKVECHKGFQLILSSKHSPGVLVPEITTKTCIVDFSITFSGLQNHLLTAIVRQQRPSLETKFQETMVEIAKNKRQLILTEDKILSILSEASGAILDNDDAINAIVDCQSSAASLQGRIALAEKTKQELDETRAAYISVATRGATLFFIASKLQQVNPIARFSLAVFQQFFMRALESQNVPKPLVADDAKSKVPPPSESFEEQIERTRNLVTLYLIKCLSRALMSSQRSLLSFLLAVAVHYSETSAVLGRTVLDLFVSSDTAVIDDAPVPTSSTGRSSRKSKAPVQVAMNFQRTEAISQEEWAFFLRGVPTASERPFTAGSSASGAASDSGSSFKAVGNIGWLTPDQSVALRYLESHFLIFSHLVTSCLLSGEMWQQLIAAGTVYRELKMQRDWSYLTGFQRLILIKVICPALLTQSVQHFIADVLGEAALTPLTLDLGDLYAESTIRTPILLIQPRDSGIDPADYVQKLAESLEKAGKVQYLSLGRGQTATAISVVTRGMQYGHWVFLQNCHLAVSWMPTLQKLLDSSFDSTTAKKPVTKIDPSFRLWLSTEPTSQLPQALVESSLKLTLEVPVGVQARTLRALSGLSEKEFDGFDPSETQGNTARFAILPPVNERRRSQASPRKPSMAFSTKLVKKPDLFATRVRVWKKMVLRLCLFHSTIQERKRYGLLGWNAVYDFTEADLQASLAMMKCLVFELDLQLTWPARWSITKEIVGHVMYGGYMSDTWDSKRLLRLFDQFGSDPKPDALQSISEEPARSDPLEFLEIPDSVSEGNSNDYQAFVAGIPASQFDMLMGLPASTDRMLRLAEANTLLDDLLKVQAADRPKVATPVASRVFSIVKNVLASLPGDFETYEDDARRAKLLFLIPDATLVDFLLHEALRYNVLLGLMRTSLESLQKVFNGNDQRRPGGLHVA
eukprot:m.896166 g.896166  ORF g.896166 m.896166 type:complete len:2088 (+) comp60006_c0_seq2:2303-8566(+)